MLPKSLNYDHLYNTFNLNIPLKFNIASATVDKFSNTDRIALKNIKSNGTSRILLKGGHLNEIDLCDILYDKNKFFEFYSKKIDTNNTHGTGCTISSAITANLSKGFSLYESVSIAHKYVYKSILKAPNLGSGHGPLNHFHVIPDKL